jgi:hypothetical protein
MQACSPSSRNASGRSNRVGSSSWRNKVGEDMWMLNGPVPYVKKVLFFILFTFPRPSVRFGELEEHDLIPSSSPAMHIQKLRENFHQLKLRPEDDFERILLEDIGFVKREGVKDHVGKGSFVCLFAVFYSLRGGMERY